MYTHELTCTCICRWVLHILSIGSRVCTGHSPSFLLYYTLDRMYIHWHRNIHCTLILVSWMESLMSGNDSLDVIQEWLRTCAALYRWLGSMLSIRKTRSFALFDMESQLPPERLTLPSPMRVRIFSALSSGPVANGVELMVVYRNKRGREGGRKEGERWKKSGKFKANCTSLQMCYQLHFLSHCLYQLNTPTQCTCTCTCTYTYNI